MRSLSGRITLPLFVALAWVPTAHAGGFHVARFGGEHGHAATDHITSLYYNPAGLAAGKGLRLYVEGTFAWRKASYDRPAAAIDNVQDDPQDGAGTPVGDVAVNSGKGTLTDLLASPFIAVAHDFGIQGLGVALGLYAPFGGSAVWDKSDEWDGNQEYPGAVDGPQRWQSISGQLRTVYVTLGGAYRLAGPRLSFGLGANLNLNSVSTLRARNPGGTDHVQSRGDVFEGRALAEADSMSMSLGAGVQWEPIENKLWVGVSYQSQPGFGELEMPGVLTLKPGLAGRTDTDIDFTIAMPDLVMVGGRFRPTPRWELRLFGHYARWSVFRDNCLLDANNPDAKCSINDDGSLDSADGGAGVIVNYQRNWKDTLTFRGGVSHWIMPELELMAGLGYDQNAVPDETMDASLMDMNKMTATLGARYDLSDRVSLFGSYTQVVYFEREVPLRPVDAMGATIHPASPSRTPDSGGTYTQAVGALVIGTQVAF